MLLWILVIIFDSQLAVLVDWNTDIVATKNELMQSRNDALWQYFDSIVESDELFKSRDAMKKIIGEFKDVDRLK